jgi:hypothetical protein
MQPTCSYFFLAGPGTATLQRGALPKRLGWSPAIPAIPESYQIVAVYTKIWNTPSYASIFAGFSRS